MDNILQDALDKLASSRTSNTQKTEALTTLEHVLALACVPADSSDNLSAFITLQNTFECNVPSRLLAWISLSTSKLENIENKGVMDHEHEAEVTAISSQLVQALSLMQGVVLNHKPSKRYLGRQYTLEVLLDLLLISRHIPPPSLPSSSTTNTTTSTPPLSSAVLDTLLCILVDNCSALRAFEDAGGVQIVVKILKRAGTPREVRMKCLEFLYFYLLDESPSSLESSSSVAPSLPSRPTTPPLPSGTKTAPTTPYKPKSKPAPLSHSNTDIKNPRLAMAMGLPTSSVKRLAKTSSDSSSSSRSTSAFSSTSTSSSSRTTPPQTPPTSPPLAPRTPSAASSRLLMLRKEVDFVPLSPKKPVFGNGRVRSDASAVDPIETAGRHDYIQKNGDERGYFRTTAEKKALLGSMLGNVDALVEGVRKAGVWGLG